MSEEFSSLNADEKLKAENEFLKMKMMLEHGADFHFSSGGPPEVENDFLKYVMAFEAQHANPVYTTVYKKIGSPSHFKPVASIENGDIEKEYDDLICYMNENGVDLACCSPNISTRELYRFITEELFEKEIADIKVPGMISSFIYDEFYPDHEYDNSRIASEECVGFILSKSPFNFMGHFDHESLQLNEHSDISEKDFQLIVNRFKELFSEINLRYADVENCTFDENNCLVQGKYGVDLITTGDKMNIDDHWMVEFLFRPDCGYWYIRKVCLGGINL